MERFSRLFAFFIVLYAVLLADACAQTETALPSSTASNKEGKQTTSFFKSFEPKDWLSFAASGAALVFSLLSFFQKRSETSQARRKQLTDVLQKLSDLSTEIAKFKSLEKKEGYPPNYPNLINDQRRFLVRQAAYISQSIRRLVSPYEYLVMAGAFDEINDVEEAERFYKIASKAKHSFDRGIAVRAYARFLFLQGNETDARQNFKNAVSLVGETDRHKIYRGDTYERWAILEEEWSNADETKKLLKLALAEYGTLKHPNRRRVEVKRIEEKLGPLPVVEAHEPN
jgi:hypothetical protein